MTSGPASASFGSRMSPSVLMSPEYRHSGPESKHPILSRPLDFDPDAPGISDNIGFFDPDPRRHHPPIGEPSRGEKFGERFDEVDMASGSDALDLLDDDLVADDV